MTDNATAEGSPVDPTQQPTTQPSSSAAVPSEPATFEFRAPDDARVTPDAWQALVARIQSELVADGIDPTDAAQVLPDFVLADDSARRWHYDGTHWYGLAGQTWEPGTPPASLRLVSLTIEAAPDLPGASTAGGASVTPVAPVSPVAPTRPAQPTTPMQTANATPAMPLTQAALLAPAGPTHRVPPTGMPAWSTPNGAVAPIAMLPPNLDLAPVESMPSGWTRVIASNGWSGWVDGRILVPIVR